MYRITHDSIFYESGYKNQNCILVFCSQGFGNLNPANFTKADIKKNDIVRLQRTLYEVGRLLKKV